MAPYTCPSYNFSTPYSTSSMPVASNWDPTMLRSIQDGCSSEPTTQSCFPPITLASSEPFTNICTSPDRETCKLPPINCVPRRICNDHPRDDCCRVPTCSPCLPDCTPALCAERIPPIKKANNYEPPCQPFDGCSIYRTQFNGCYGPPARSYKPASSFDPSTAPMSGTSIYREHFTCKPIIPVRSVKAKEEYQPSCSPFEGCSTYRVDFRGCYGRPAEIMRPGKTFDPSLGRMDGITTYRNAFIPYCPAEYQYARGTNTKPQETSIMSCSPFSGCSTYRMDFPPKCIQKQPSMKPRDRSGFSSSPFCGRSTYRNDFLPFYFKDRCPDECIRPCR